VSDVAVNLRAKAVLGNVHASVALVAVPDQGRDHASASVARGDVLVAVPGRDRVDADLVADLDRASVARGDVPGLADEN